MIYPVKNPFISQKFGENPADYACWNLKGHNGIDMATFFRDNIVAAHDGEVIKVVDDPYHTLGKNVWLCSKKENDKYLVTVYAHMENICVNAGDKLSIGDKIGEMGNTGNVRGATGIHLHFGVYYFSDPTPGTYQINYNGRAFTILNYNNGFGGAIDPLILLKNMLPIIGTKNDKKQYILGEDGIYRWIYGITGKDSKVLIALHNAGIVDKNNVQWVDSIDESKIGESIALIIT